MIFLEGIFIVATAALVLLGVFGVLFYFFVSISYVLDNLNFHQN